MNFFLHPACYAEDVPPDKSPSNGDRTPESEPRSTHRIKKKKSLATLLHRKDVDELLPPMTEDSSAFPNLSETDALDHVDHSSPAAPTEPLVGGVSFMDLSSSSDGEEYQRPALLRKIRGVRSQVDLTAPDKSRVPAPSDTSSSVGTNSFGFRARVRRLTNPKESATQRFTDNSSGIATDVSSLRSFASCSSPASPRVGRFLNPDASENPPLDPDFEFNEFVARKKPAAMSSHRPKPLRSPRNISGVASPLQSPQNGKHEHVSVQDTKDSIDGYASFLCHAKTSGLPMPDMIEEDEGEWNRAVKWVRQQEMDRVAREAKAAKVSKREMRNEEAKQAQMAENRLQLAKRFISRTSTAWVPKVTAQGLPVDEACHKVIAEALDLANQFDSADPGLTELRKRFFAGISRPFSRLRDAGAPPTTPLPSIPGFKSTLPTTQQDPRHSPSQLHRYSASSKEEMYQQVFPSRAVSPVGTSRFESSQPSPDHNPVTDVISCNGLGIQMVTLHGSGPSLIHDPTPHDESLQPQRNAFGPGQTDSSCSTQESLLSMAEGSSPGATSCATGLTEGTQSQLSLQSSASATLANARIFKVDRDSKIQDRFVPKRTSDFYHTIEAARELAEARMGICPSPNASSPPPQKYAMFDTPIKACSSDRNLFKKAASHPTVRAVVSSLSMRSPDATEMISSPLRTPITISTPLSPNANHPAFRSAQGIPVTPIATGVHSPTAQEYNDTASAPRASTSTASVQPFMTPLSIAVSTSSSVAASAENRWAQRVLQKSKVERVWQETGVLKAPVQQTPIAETTVSLANGSHTGLSQPLIQTPPQAILHSTVTPRSSSAAQKHKLSSNISRKTQDSPTPLNIRKLSASPRVPPALSLPDSPAPLYVSKLRAHPAVRRVIEQDLKDPPEPVALPTTKDPFGKSGSSIQGDEDWPLSDVSSSTNTVPEPPQRSPLDGRFDEIITTWRHASATQESVTFNASNLANVTAKYQHIRQSFDLQLLQAPDAGKLHPNHPHHWHSTNVMCKDIHSRSRTSSDTAITESGDDGVRVCSFCQETCCYFGQQIGLTSIRTKGRDQSLDQLKNRARSHTLYLRGNYPEGVEDYQTLMDCALCARVCCPGCGSICQYPMCSQPVCKNCVDYEDGICGQHRFI